MYIDIVPNRNSPPAILLRESYREGKKVLQRTIANLSEVPRNVVEGLRILLRGGAVVEHFEDSFEIERSLPHGHVAAVLGTLCKLKLDMLIAPEPSEERNRVVAMVVARILDPRRVEGLGIGLLYLAELGQGARARFLVEPPSRRELGAGRRSLGFEGKGRPDPVG